MTTAIKIVNICNLHLQRYLSSRRTSAHQPVCRCLVPHFPQRWKRRKTETVQQRGVQNAPLPQTRELPAYPEVHEATAPPHATQTTRGRRLEMCTASSQTGLPETAGVSLLTRSRGKRSLNGQPRPGPRDTGLRRGRLLPSAWGRAGGPRGREITKQSRALNSAPNRS